MFIKLTIKKFFFKSKTTFKNENVPIILVYFILYYFDLDTYNL